MATTAAKTKEKPPVSTEAVEAPVTEENTTTVEETPAVSFAVDEPWKIDLTTHPDSTITRLWAQVKTTEGPLWETYERIKAVQPPTAKEIQQTLTDSDDPSVIAFRDRIAELQAALEEAEGEAFEYVQSGIQTVPAEELEAMKVDFRLQRNSLSEQLRAVDMLAHALKIEGVEELAKKYVAPNLGRAASTNGSSKSTGSTTPRPRIESVTISNANITRTYPRLSGAVLAIKSTDTATVLSKWLEAAGETEWQKVTDVISFELDGWTVEVTPLPVQASE